MMALLLVLDFLADVADLLLLDFLSGFTDLWRCPFVPESCLLLLKEEPEAVSGAERLVAVAMRADGAALKPVGLRADTERHRACRTLETSTTLTGVSLLPSLAEKQ